MSGSRNQETGVHFFPFSLEYSWALSITRNLNLYSVRALANVCLTGV